MVSRTRLETLSRGRRGYPGMAARLARRRRGVGGGGGPAPVEDAANRTLLTMEQQPDGTLASSGMVLDAYHLGDTDFLFENNDIGVDCDKVDNPFTGLGYTSSFHNNHLSLSRGIRTTNTYASLPSRIKLAGASEFTVEYYAQAGPGNGDKAICGFWDAGSTTYEWLAGMADFHNNFFYSRHGAGFNFTAAGSPSGTTWKHFAWCVSGTTTLQGWMDGTRVFNATINAMVSNAAQRFTIGCLQNGAGLAASYYPNTSASGPRIGPIHIHKGTAKYDGATITPDFPVNPFA